jgi:DNA-binding transcriptional LysR family regulator
MASLDAINGQSVSTVKHMDLLALTDFNLVARHGGFGKASRATGRPKATLSRRVAELESSLGLRLFERGARAPKLTQEGKALHERTSPLLTEIDETAAALAAGGGKPRGNLRISAPLLFSQIAMGKLAAGFSLRYPEVSLEVTTEDRTVDMVEEGYDLAIRVNPRSDESLVGRVFMSDRQVIVASPRVTRPRDGKAVPAVVRESDRGLSSWNIKSEKRPATMAFIPVLSLSSLIMVRDATIMGAGAARLPVSLVSRDLTDGTLVHWADVDAPDTTLWALYPSRRLLNARVSAFLEYLKEAFPKGAPEELAAFIRI